MEKNDNLSSNPNEGQDNVPKAQPEAAEQSAAASDATVADGEHTAPEDTPVGTSSEAPEAKAVAAEPAATDASGDTPSDNPDGAPGEKDKKPKHRKKSTDPTERLRFYNEHNNIEKTEKRISVLRRTAVEIKNYNAAMRMLAAALGVLVLLTIILYIIAALYMKTGSFTVRVDKIDMTKYGLTLSESRDITYPTSHLNTEIDKNITNISEAWLPDNLGMIDGDHSGANYVAYTFYLQNGGETDVSYEYNVVMDNVTNALDEAIRLRLYVDDVPTTYAKTRSDGKGPEGDTVEFYSSTIMAKGRVDNFKSKDITKFTVVIWIEGDDPDCVDWLVGGEMKIDMDMSIVH